MVTPSEIDADTFATYSDALQAVALTTTRLAATSLPADLSFHRTIDPALAHDVDGFADRVLTLVSRLIRITSGTTSRIREEEDVVDEFVRTVVDPMEGMLEGTDGALDVFLGKRKDPAIHVPAVPVDPHQNKSKKRPFQGRLDPAITHASHIQKPQSSFKHTFSNIDESPYIPSTLIPHKWCAKVPLGYVFHDEGTEGHRCKGDEEERRKSMLHPYYYELTHPSYPDHIFNPPLEPSFPPSFATPSSGALTASHPLTFVSTPEALLSMANTMSSATELAVDLEHHSYRSYKGFLALMQISTRQGDFLVDLLVPEVREGLRQAKGKSVEGNEEACIADEAGEIIARVFADPSVIKVLHGAESDIVWLQQDFNIFVVGLFDTFHASKLLKFPKHSLAYLLETYCDFIPDKRYQLADWRIRPLPTEMSTYARSDTHFLLYIYDVLRLLLIERSSTDPAISDDNRPLMNTKQMHHGCALIHSVLTRSSRTTLRLYDIEVYDTEGGTGSTGWDTLARKWNKTGLIGSPSQTQGTEVQGSQVAVYKAVHRWREDVAREEDENTRYVLPTHHLFLLAERIPTTVPDLLSLFGGPGGVNGGVSPVLKRRAGELVWVIKNAMEATESATSLQRLTEDRCSDSKMTGSAVVEESEAINSTVASLTAAKPTDESRLWAIAPSSTSATSIAIPCSFLLGVGISERPQEKGVSPSSSVGGEGAYFATGTVLHGTTTTFSSSTIRFTFTQPEVPDHSAERFKNLMEKIHKTLVVAPAVSLPSSAPSVKTQASEKSLSGVPLNDGMDQSSAVHETPDRMPPAVEGQIEIPFVPTHKRQTLSNPQSYDIKDDTIVVVGQAGTRQRKRKRDKARTISSMPQSKSGMQLGGAEASLSTADHDQDMEEFNYSSVPNLLDSESKRGAAQAMHEEDERRTKKQRHGKESTSSSTSYETASAIQAFASGTIEDKVLAILLPFYPFLVFW